MTQVEEQNKDLHPFGGCRRLEGQYRSIGHALVESEKNIFSSAVESNFRTSVAFIPDEVLESYLDDLLDSTVAEEKLFIKLPSKRGQEHVLFGSGFFLALALGFLAISQGAHILLSLSLTLCIGLPLFAVWYFAPRASLVRRMAFAKVVSRELSHRRGGDDEDNSRKSFLKEWLLPTGATGSSSGAARQIFH